METLLLSNRLPRDQHTSTQQRALYFPYYIYIYFQSFSRASYSVYRREERKRVELRSPSSSRFAKYQRERERERNYTHTHIHTRRASLATSGHDDVALRVIAACVGVRAAHRAAARRRRQTFLRWLADEVKIVRLFILIYFTIQAERLRLSAELCHASQLIFFMICSRYIYEYILLGIIARVVGH